MKNKVPVILLIIVSVALAMALYSSKQEIVSLQQQIAVQNSGKPADTRPEIMEKEKPVSIVATSDPTIIPQEAVEPPAENNAGRRMMSSMAKMMENPTMNKVMEASQRGAVGALYTDLIDYLNLDNEETKYFMDLLMHRQMTQVDVAMKMMGGNLSEEESAALKQQLEEVTELVKSEMKSFLNNPEDFEEYQFYEKTMGERMMLSQMDQSLSSTEAELSDQAYRDLLGMMHDERNNFNFSSNLHDENNNDLSPERFSGENVKKFSNDMDALNQQIIQQAQSMLTPEQLKAFEAAIEASAEMQKAQIEMASQMFRKKEI